MSNGKTILFGGTFDPIHLGHTTVAAFAARYINAEKVIFVPAKRSVLKLSAPQACDGDRLKMISLATDAFENFEVSDYELKKSGPNYTIETVMHFKESLRPEKTIYWLMGADNLSELPRWYKITELIDGCNLTIMYRGGFPEPAFEKLAKRFSPEQIKKLRDNVIKTPLIDVSSTEIRKKLACGEDVTGMLDPVVLEYIRRHNLYR